ncbi:MAG: cytochrome c oxidase subunit 3 [Nitrococcus sp.]|nr:cytochrome c oxidase subunit 3 [Nitrococcus sp.]
MNHENVASEIVTVEPPAESQRRLPGDLAMWFFIFIELAVFGLLLISLAVARSNEPEVFAAGARTLTTGMGLANTVALLTGSYCAVRAVTAIKAGAAHLCARWLLAAAGTGLVYLIVKVSEYVHLFMDGYTLRSSTFYFFYFFTTFFHLMHVVLGMTVLIVVASRCRRGFYSEDAPRAMGAVESGASYWHMVDLVWLVLFTIIYILA